MLVLKIFLIIYKNIIYSVFFIFLNLFNIYIRNELYLNNIEDTESDLYMALLCPLYYTIMIFDDLYSNSQITHFQNINARSSRELVNEVNVEHRLAVRATSETKWNKEPKFDFFKGNVIRLLWNCCKISFIFLSHIFLLGHFCHAIHF